MVHLVQAGTDGATLCAFDPAALPDDFDLRVADDPMGLMEALRDGGRLWVGGTGGDGIHHVEVTVSAPAPEGSALWQGVIDVPSGSLWVCGAEYIARDPQHGSAFTPKGGLGRHASMGTKVDLAPGRYALLVTKPVASDTPARVTAAQWRVVIGLGMAVLGGIASAIMGVALLIAGLVKAVQWFTGNPLAASGLHALPPMALIFAGGLAAAFVGKRLARRGAPSDTAPQAPDLVLTLTQIDSAAST